MSKAIYLATTEPNSGKSIVSLGIMQLLLGKTAKVGYFRPIIDDFEEGRIDDHIDTVLKHFEVDQKFEDSYAYTRSQVVQLKNMDKDDEIIGSIINKYKAIEDRFDIVLVEGTDFSGEGAIIEWDINVLIAKNLGIPAIIIANGMGKSLQELVGNIYMAYDSFREKGVEVLLTVANKVQTENLEKVLAGLKSKLPKKVFTAAIPLNPILGNPTVKEIAQALSAKVLFGEDFINNQAGEFSVGAMQLRNYLNHLKKDSLVITPGDRADIILGALQANISTNYPNLSGIVLTGGLLPEDSIIKLIEGLSDVIPILSVADGTFSVTNRIGTIKPRIYPENKEKITTSIQEFEKYVPTNELAERLITFKAEGITPRMFQYNLLKRAKSTKKHIVLPEGNDERILKATKKLLDTNAVTITLLGDTEQIMAKISELDISLDANSFNIIDPKSSPNFLDYATTLYELRKEKMLILPWRKILWRMFPISEP
eukprot:TRINITY_DN4128_c0_g2_i2.p1 TRINITY_DN4128_c0_g2~~TRINITY_DN4128_c0_g2_i2.p1  ORF type:complete len:483 (-),score=101.12 TRINITY_DN4128_c0_g2_i2:757-2205(-)